MANEQLEELHSIELELLKRFIEICRENHITYYVIGGTLLGAIRHGGFIPWDDDIDVAVPRDDYNRLIKIMTSLEDNNVGMLYYKVDHELYFYPAKVISKKYKIHDPRAVSGYSHPWIDVLPIDGKPNGKLRASIFKLRMDMCRLLLAFCYIDRLRDINRPLAQRVLIKIGKVCRLDRWIDSTKVKDMVDKILSSNQIEDCREIGTCMGAYYFHEFVPKEYFGKGTTIKFCDMNVNAPELIDLYLKHMYGDYMELPPESKRQSSHMSGLEPITEND